MQLLQKRHYWQQSQKEAQQPANHTDLQSVTFASGSHEEGKKRAKMKIEEIDF
jgi:hypothetical protein